MARDDDGKILGPSIEAFRLRKNEAYLSVNIREKADVNPLVALKKIKECHVVKNLKVHKNSIYTQGASSEILGAFKQALLLEEKGKKADPSYAGLFGFPDDCDYELEALANIHWCDWIIIKQ